VRIDGNDIEGHGGPRIVAAGVGGLTVAGNYYGANNLDVPGCKGDKTAGVALAVGGDVFLCTRPCIVHS
jgi:hypothetical protein